MRRRHLAPALVALGLVPLSARAATRAEIDREVAAAIETLRGQPENRVLFDNAKAILIFPRIITAGLMVGGQYGEGAMRVGNRTVGYYRFAGASVGLQAGAQISGLAMFFMNEEARRALDASDGWDIGTGPSVVALDRGAQANLSVQTLTNDVYAVTFSQQGLMAALGLRGTKITRIEPG